MLNDRRPAAAFGLGFRVGSPFLTGGLALLIIPCSAAEPTRAPASPTTGPACILTTEAERAVTRIAGADTLQLDDGSELRLAGILPPRRPLTASGDAPWPPGEQAIQALSRLVIGRTIAVAAASGRRTDRYGRKIAHAFVLGDGQPQWVQGRLLTEGHARAHALDGDTCLAAMLRREGEARAFGRGSWSNAAYKIRSATATAELMRLRSTFQIVEGRVRSAATVRGAVYLNFGPLWRTDFTAGLLKRRQQGSAEPSNLLDTAALQGRRVRVRGWIERNNGPFIEITHPSEIELLDAPSAPIATRPAPLPDAVSTDDAQVAE
ncbi:MAG: thermonuclease family protein [Hyphomicrobium sp.]